MKIFRGFLKYEWNNFFTTINTVILIVFALALLLEGQFNIYYYKPHLEECNNPSVAGRNYNVFEADYKMSPSAAAILFLNSGANFPVHGYFSKGKVYTISGLRNPYKNNLSTDFSSILLKYGAILLMFFGAGAFRHRNFNRMCNSYLSLKQIYFYTLFSRYLIASFVFFVFLSDAVLQILLNGLDLVYLDYQQIVRFSLLWLCISFFFLCLGSLTGMMKDRGNVRLVVFCLWFFQIFISPTVVDSLTSFHNVALTKGLDEWERYALVMPATTYMMMIQSMSGSGYEDRAKFRKFVVNGQSVAVGKKAETVYRIESKMPAHFLRGMLIIFLYNLLLLGTGYFVLKRVFYKPSSKGIRRYKQSQLEIVIPRGEHDVYSILWPEIVEHVFSRFFTGHRNGQVFICAPEDLPPDVRVIDLLQLMCTITGVEDITDQNELSHILYLTFSKLNPYEQLRVLMKLAELRKSNLYLFYNTVKSMQASETFAFRNFTRQLQHQPVGASIIYLTTDSDIQFNDAEEARCIVHSSQWNDLADMLARME